MTQIESNEVDTSVVSQGIPSIQQRSAQSNFQINLGETVILGDFTTDAETNSTSKSPGLGDIPILGNLFKRKVKSVQKDRLFFAIRVEVVPVGETINTAPIQLDTTPRIPENDFFRPYNVPSVPVTTTNGPVVVPTPTPKKEDFTPVTENEKRKDN
jgi:Flp pilus assembly secretin CpaC